MKQWKRQSSWVQLGLFALCLSGACADEKSPKKEPVDAGSEPVVQRGPGRYQVGAFTIELDAQGGFAVSHEMAPDRPLLANPKGTTGIAALRVSDRVTETGGSFEIDEVVNARCDKLEDVAIEGTEALVTLTATLKCEARSAAVSLSFARRSDKSLDFKLSLEGEELPFNQVELVQAAEADERFVGFGEQFSFVNMRGRKFPILVEEGGIGRNGAFASAGSFYSTYAPMPFMFTDLGKALLLDNAEMSWFDLTAEDRVSTRVRATEMRGHILFGKAPRDVIEALTEFTGRMQKLPAWINEGAVVGIQGGTERVREVLAGLEAQDAKIAAFWLQDWVGRRETGIGARLWWNWQLNQAQYPGWKTLVADLEAKDIRVMTYVNPYLVDVEGDPNFSRNLYGEARSNGYLIKNAMGMPYVHVSGTFEAGIVDLTNPKAASWLKEVLRDEVLGVGAAGYMADFGEAVAFDAVLASKEPASDLHNVYPELWAALNHELFEEEGLLGEGVFFMRSGYTRSPGLSTLFWGGDQSLSWDADDGLQSGMKGVLTGGLSGISLNHTDIGGYTAIFQNRTKELLQRWTEMNAFTATFRTHEGSRPDLSAQIYDDEESLAHFARFSRVFAALAPYRDGLMKEASETGMPLVRHLLLEYPDSPRAWDEDHTFMLGPDVLVAPVVVDGARTTRAYVPEGSWVHLWSGKAYTKAETVDVAAPLGQPAVFYRKGSAAGVALEKVK